MTAKSPASLTQFPCQVMIHEMRIMELQEVIVPAYFIPGGSPVKNNAFPPDFWYGSIISHVL